MILVLTGQERFAFDRLLAMVDEGVGRGIIPSPVFAQTGCSRYEPKHLRASAYFASDRLASLIREAEGVITHAGVGSILMTLHAGKVPIIVPRRRDLREHVDDHQVELAGRLQETGRARVVGDATELYAFFQGGAWRGRDRKGSTGPAPGQALMEGLGSIIDGLAARSRRPGISSKLRG